VLERTVGRIAGLAAFEGVIGLGSLVEGDLDEVSDLDLLAVTAPGRFEEAWADRSQVAGDVLVAWDSSSGGRIRWAKWLTRELVKVECGIAEPGSRELAEPFAILVGEPTLADTFPRVDLATVRERAEALRKQQEVFAPTEMTPGERIDWKLSELKQAVRAATRRPRTS
jgi:hypothetical protein